MNVKDVLRTEPIKYCSEFDQRVLEGVGEVKIIILISPVLHGVNHRLDGSIYTSLSTKSTKRSMMNSKPNVCGTTKRQSETTSVLVNVVLRRAYTPNIIYIYKEIRKKTNSASIWTSVDIEENGNWTMSLYGRIFLVTTAR